MTTHPDNAGRLGCWIQTYTGIPFWPLDPRPEEIDPRDLAHSLSLQTRYLGHCGPHYSVAEHSVRCSYLVPKEHALWALLHDASEAYIGDWPKPLKQTPGIGDAFRAIERKLMLAVCERFGLDPEEPAAVKEVDDRLLETEARDLLNGHGRGVLWAGSVEPYPASVLPWSHHRAECAYLARLHDLTYKEPA